MIKQSNPQQTPFRSGGGMNHLPFLVLVRAGNAEWRHMTEATSTCFAKKSSIASSGWGGASRYLSLISNKFIMVEPPFLEKFKRTIM